MSRIASLISMRFLWIPTSILFIVAVQAALLWKSCEYSSPTPDEPAHLLAGIDYWQTGSTHLYNVNPPLTKLWSTLPIVVGQTVDLPRYGSLIWDERDSRSEFYFGSLFVKQEGERFFEYLLTARRMCAIFAVVGTFGVFCLAAVLLDVKAAFLAAMIWAFNPITLGHGAILASDIPGASMGCWAILAAYLSLRETTIHSLIWTGVLIGLAILTKFTWLVAIPLWPCAVWAFETFLKRDTAVHCVRGYWSRQAISVFCVFFVAWVVVCTGYRWQGMLTPLGEFKFVSETLRGENENRFRDTWMHSLPAALPSDMIRGMDQQWQDFDKPLWAYLNGQWQKGGWWYYYLCALAIKLPLGLLLLLAIGVLVSRRNIPLLLIIVCPTLVFLWLVSTKTNMNEHTRYLWVILPLIIVLAASAINAKLLLIRILAVGCGVWTVYAGLVSFPCGLTYGNELVGSSRNTWRVLAGSNIDWSLDWLATKRWLKKTGDTSCVALHGKWLDSIQGSGLNVSSFVPQSIRDRVHAGEEIVVTLILPVDSRLTVQRDNGYPTMAQQLIAEKILCCTEVYRVPIRDIGAIREIVWLDPDAPFFW